MAAVPLRGRRFFVPSVRRFLIRRPAMTTCETLTHGTCVFLSQRHRFGTDAMLLADF